MSFGSQFITSLVVGGDASALVELGDVETFFRPSDKPVYDFVHAHLRKHQQLPGFGTIKIHTGVDLTKWKGQTTEPPSYYLDLMKLLHIELEIKKVMALAGSELTDNKDPTAALDLLLDTALRLRETQQQAAVVDFRQSYEPLMQDYVDAYNGDKAGLHLGWPTIDSMSNGLNVGDVYSMVGRPAAGKTWQLLYAGMHGWKASASKTDDYADPVPGSSRLFVSMEMNPLEIRKRMAAMVTGLPIKNLYKTDFSSKQLEKFKAGLIGVQHYGNPFWIVDGNLKATVEDIWALCRQLKPGAVFIDGGYLLQHPTEKDRYRRVAENAQLIKQEIATICPTCVTWQFAKSAAVKAGKKQTAENTVGLEDIGYSEAIGQVSSLVTGLFQPESVDTVEERIVKIIKGRKGESGQFRCNWDFDKMNFSEISEPDMVDVEFM